MVFTRPFSTAELNIFDSEWNFIHKGSSRLFKDDLTTLAVYAVTPPPPPPPWCCATGMAFLVPCLVVFLYHHCCIGCCWHGWLVQLLFVISRGIW